MRCPRCDCAETQVKKTIRLIESPLAEKLGPVKMRRRECRNCGRPFQTYEIHQEHYEQILELEEQRRGGGKPMVTEEERKNRFVRGRISLRSTDP